jgi:hypothetical protein
VIKPPLPLYALTLFPSASLLFFMEPMTAKMLLPLLGGAPAVWNTCVLFFQVSLLAGYAYAYASSRWLSSRIQLRKTGPDGIVLLHISNRYFRLLPIVSAIAREVGAAGFYLSYNPPAVLVQQWENLSSLWVVLAKRGSALSFLNAPGSAWQPLAADPSVRAWSDDYSGIFSAINWR